MTDANNTAAIKALCKAQAAMTRAMKDTSNPFFNSKYADLTSVQDACLPALHENGFAVMHSMRHEEKASYLDTILLHESGASWTCPVELLVDKSNMQGLGSAITYARRYGLMCVSGVAPEDDDGNKAAANPPKKQQKAQEPSGPSKAAIDKTLITIGNIDDLDELSGYWKALNVENKAMAHHADVIAAKDAVKARLSPPADDVDKARDDGEDSIPY